MLHFEGDQDFAPAPAVVWAKLSDLTFLVDSIPDLQASTILSPQEATCVVRPGFSFMRGNLDLAVKLTSTPDSQTLRLQVHGKGIGSSNDLDLLLQCAAQGTGTRVHWTADVTNLTGLLKAMPKGLLQASAQRVIGDVWARVKTKLG